MRKVRQIFMAVKWQKQVRATFRSTSQGFKLAMVFLDANHPYEAVKEEIIWARKLGVSLICGHDYGKCMVWDDAIGERDLSARRSGLWNGLV